MTRLALGVLLWSIVHFIPAIAPSVKKNMVDRHGEYPYKGIFSLLMAFAIYLIISGWGAAGAGQVYVPPEWGGYAALVLVLIGFILFLAPYPPNNIRRMMRHPQLLGMVCWGVGHLLSNGSERAFVFFGGLSVWAIIEIFLLNRRDGEWIKPASVSAKKDLVMVLFCVLVYMVFLYTHHLLFGGSPLT